MSSAPLLPPEAGFIGLSCRPFIRSLSKHLCSEHWLSGLLRGAGPRPVGRQDSHHVGGGVARKALGASQRGFLEEKASRGLTA